MDSSGLRAVVFDLDGTIYIGKTLVPGAEVAVAAVRYAGIKVVFMTNASYGSRANVAAKLRSLGIAADEHDVVTSANLATQYAKQRGHKRVNCIGGPGLKEDLIQRGLSITEEEDADCLVMGYTPDFSFETIVFGITMLRSKSKEFICCNLDANFPSDGGKLMPGCGALVASIVAGAERCVDFVAGKPEIHMLEYYCRREHLRPGEILVVGDRIESDIEMAKRHHSRGVLLSNENAISDDGVVTIDSLFRLVSMFQ